MVDVPYSDQLALKTQYLEGAFHAFDPRLILAPIIPAPSSTYYRNKMEFSFAKTAEGHVYLGLKRRGKFDQVIPLETCFLADPVTPVILKFTATFFTPTGLDTWDYRAHTGVLRYLAMRQSKTTNEWMITLVVAQDDPVFELYAEALQAAFPQITSILLGIQPGRGDTAFTATQRVLYGTPMLIERLGDLEFKISPSSFFQTNTHQAAKLYETILQMTAPESTDTIFDMYCGTGTIGLYMARFAKEVIGVEENPSSIQNAIQNAKHNQITNATFIVENVRRFLKFDQTHCDKMVVDPPRDGLIPKVLRRIIERRPSRLVYVSCNPNTLLRDLKLLTDSAFCIEAIQPVDMFPNTWHVETIVRLTFVGDSR